MRFWVGVGDREGVEDGNDRWQKPRLQMVIFSVENGVNMVKFLKVKVLEFNSSLWEGGGMN